MIIITIIYLLFVCSFVFITFVLKDSVVVIIIIRKVVVAAVFVVVVVVIFIAVAE